MTIPENNFPSNLFIVSAPSGAGKTSLLAHCLTKNPQLNLSISHTTRAPRKGEVDGENYHFVSKDDFEKMITAGQFLESATVFDHYYGTSQPEVEKQLMAGNDLVLEIDWQGAQQVRKKIKSNVSIFIVPPSLEVLKQRLSDRGQDDPQVIERRLAEAREEISHYPEFDYLIINDDFEQASKELNAIFLNAQILKKAQSAEVSSLLSSLLNPAT